MRGTVVITVRASAVCLFSVGIADAFVSNVSHIQLQSRSRAQGAGVQQELRRENRIRIYASLWPTKPSLKPSWKSPRLVSPSGEGTSTKPRDPVVVERTETSPSSTTSASRESYRAFEKPNWRTPKMVTSSASSSIATPTTVPESVAPSTTTPITTSQSLKTPSFTSSGMNLDGFSKSIEEVKEAVVPFTKAIRENMAEGTIGERGEQWALGQVLILLCIALGNIPVLGNLLLFLAGPGFMVSGIALGGGGVVTLGKSLSPWPVPVDDNELQTSGVFGLVRHPSYAGEIRYTYPVSCSSSSSTGSSGPKSIHNAWLY